METHLVYFLSACVLMRTWWLAAMSCACQLLNYTLATEYNVGNVRVCACCNHFPITWNEFYYNTEPNNFEFSHKVHFSKGFFLGKISRFYRSALWKKSNLEVSCKWNSFGYWNSCKRLPNFVNVAALIPYTDKKISQSILRKWWFHPQILGWNTGTSHKPLE